MRELSDQERKNLSSLTGNSVSLTLIELTKTGLKKSIMDATGIVRNYLRVNNIHDYDLQSQGQAHKISIGSVLYKKNSTCLSNTSLYQPKTKKGDPRIWFSGLKTHANANDILALVYFDNQIHVINLSLLPVCELMDSNETNPLKELVQEINLVETQTSSELLKMLQKIAKYPVLSLLDADTSVGRTLETALNIPINSSKQPDYKGIELKSFRDERSNRKTLFAQVPNWGLSKFKSSAEILDSFGYQRPDGFKLYCTVSAISINSQGLSLKVDADINHLVESSDKNEVGDFLIWTLEKLHSRLLEKHRETFWVSAETIYEDGKKYFFHKEVEHTKKPIISQFDLLLEQGAITVDYLIKRTASGGAKEKEPIFKLKKNSLNLLFPLSEHYFLTR